MTELEKIEYAKSFVDKLANGINPLDDSLIPENDIVNNVRLSRCFFYVSDILRQVIENGGVQPAKTTNRGKKEFSLTDEQRSKIQISETALSVSEICEYLNSLVDTETTRKLPTTAITNWLVGLQLLEVVVQPDGKNKKIPTGEGRNVGIIAEERAGRYGRYTVVLYSPNAQQFIYDNIDAIVDEKNKSKK
ncbi:MAG: hypothetical protein IJZ51_00845 [Ruminiclostridium sp.]|nr:hypothetical protein [Ruminiclostridium sp.]